ncbi:MAG: multicomponent Na+:H+ antiporter subunit D [Parasphingorhabdus sp.]|jgi:multicomponent Na+:H+ antiporter subunit D
MILWMIDLPPFIPFYLAALLAGVTRGWLRAAIMLAVPIVGGVHLWGVVEGNYLSIPLMGFELEPYRVDGLSLLFGYLFHLAAFIGIVYSLHIKDRVQQVAALLYAGSALGAVFAGDLITLFVFWEMLAVTSVFLILARRTQRAQRAAMRYLIIQVLSGVLLLAGALLYFQKTGSMSFEYIGLEGLAGALIFLAFGIKCAFPFVHNWLTDAYPEATPTGAVFLSAFTTKVAVYALARGYPGTEALVYIGAAMTCFPIFYAVIENDLRRVLAYSMINQIGFMVAGIGIGTDLALNGAVAHAFNDVIFKGLLMMSMGAVLHQTGKMNGSDLGSLYKTMPWTTTFCIVGAASISAFPLFSGFVSKAMVMVAVMDEGHVVIWMMMLFASAGVFHHAGIKIPFFAFFGHDPGLRPGEAPINMRIAMAIGAVLCIVIGCFPFFLYDLLPWPVDYEPYDLTHVLTQLQLLFFSAAAFAWLKLSNIYPPELHSTNLDVDWFYRRLAPQWLKQCCNAFAKLDSGFRSFAMTRYHRGVASLVRTHGPQGVLARTWPIGSMALWAAIVLAGSLLLFYLR